MAGIIVLLFVSSCTEDEPAPVVVPEVTATPASLSITSGTPASIELKSDVTSATFKWTVLQNGVSGASDGTGNSISHTLNLTGNETGSVTYVITPMANGVSGSPKTVVIEVKPVVKVTYLADVKQIFTTSCAPCHMASGYNSLKLDNYAVAKSKITHIIDRVERSQGSAGFMPQGGTKLSDAHIATLKKWLEDGLLEK